MKKNILKLSILMIITMVIFTGCKVQTVEQFNKEELVEIDEIEQIEEEQIEEEQVEEDIEEPADGEKDKTEDKKADKTEDNDIKDKDKIVSKGDKTDNKQTDTKKPVNNDKDKNTDKLVNKQPIKTKPVETKPVEKPKPSQEKQPVEQSKPAEKPNPVEKPKPIPTEKPKPVEKPKPIPTEKPKPVEKPIPKKQYVTIEIRVDSILKNYDKLDPKLQSEKFVPSNGVILGKTSIELLEGESVFDILLKATRQNRIHMEYQGGSDNQYGSAYIKGINNIYEFSCGELSGWMYKVNGVRPNHGVSAHKLKDGDSISFNYTCDQGRDI